MGSFDKKLFSANAPGATVESWPQLCNHQDCENESIVAFVLVTDRQGRSRSANFQRYGYIKKMNDDQSLFMRDGFEFDGWVTRCAKCYTDELIKRNASAGCYAELLSARNN